MALGYEACSVYGNHTESLHALMCVCVCLSLSLSLSHTHTLSLSLSLTLSLSLSVYGNDAESLHSLAHMYEHGLSTPRNATQALEMYARSKALRMLTSVDVC